MEHSDPIPNKKKKKKKLVKKYKSERAKAVPKDSENTYSIYHLKIGEATNDLDDSK